MQRGLLGTVLNLLRNRSYIAIAVITLLTLSLVGAVLLTTTSVGCSPANWLGVKTTRCTSRPVANRTIPTPSPTSQPTSQSTPLNPGASAPYTPSSSNNPPYNPGASSYPPYNPGSSGGSPVTYPSSGGFPPLPSSSSGFAGPGVSVSCRLPVYAGGPGSGGFIAFPGSTFVADPRSSVTVPSPSPNPTPAPGMGMGYPGWYGSTYDAAYSKWLPVGMSWVSPDGAHYAYPLSGNVYAQSVAGGGQLVLGAGKQYSVIAVENDGVYVTAPNQPGLWFLAFSGTAKQVSTTGYWQAESHGSAYGTATSSVPSGATITIVKLDVLSGTTSDFFTQQGGQSQVTGFDGQGHPVVRVTYPGGVGLYIATAANTSTYIAMMFYGGFYGLFPQGLPVADSHGLWFSTGNGVILYTDNAWYMMSNIGGQLAGACA